MEQQSSRMENMVNPIIKQDIIEITSNTWYISTEIEGYLKNLGFKGQLINII